ncbi:Transposase [Phytophthora palmivora]|uniref:Transposase n=1 Tax=Phytophthora palmivora TaxID=4796 RepID=A0A2P4XER5_9STRA|nr:Transposase [Phytophthora palmivora]
MYFRSTITSTCCTVSEYLVDRACRFVKGLYQVRWLDTQFQSQVECMILSMIQRGNTNYKPLHGRATGPGISRLCAVKQGEVVQIDGSSDALEDLTSLNLSTYTNQDPAAKVRPLLNLLKSTVKVSVACRSKYGKPLIVYNPLKPGGKYNFRICMLCCATTWISLNFRLHCARTITDRLAGVTTADEAQALSDEISETSVIPQCVLEVVEPVYGAHRIVNSGNHNTSVQLLEVLRVDGLYSRGTVRKSSAQTGASEVASLHSPVITNYCLLHGVCLCQIVHAFSPKVYTCPQVTWTYWEKYHRYDLTPKLFSNKDKDI